MNTPMSPPDFTNLRLLKVFEEFARKELAEALNSADPITRREAQETYDVARQALLDAHASMKKRFPDDQT